jgi:hypothetical protein
MAGLDSANRHTLEIAVRSQGYDKNLTNNDDKLTMEQTGLNLHDGVGH